MKSKFLLDKEELEILESIENNELIDVPLTKEEKERLSKYAKYTQSLNRKKQTTIRFDIRDLAIIKARAKELGIGYQNLIQALVHQYAIGKIKLEL